MAALSNKQIELFAVNAVTTAANFFPLIPDIPIGDKGISFDGHIDVMENVSEKREAFFGKVPVQVKGTCVEEFSGSTRNFSLELAHFENFYKVNGAVLFVVEVDSAPNGNTKIFYKQLLPYELKIIISQFGHQKTRSIELRELAETSIYIVCRQFLIESRKQTINLIENNPFKKEDFTSFKMTSLTFNPLKDTNIEAHDFTFYGIIGSLHVPIGMGKPISEIVEGLDTIIIDGTEFKEVMVKIHKNMNNGKDTISIEDSLELTISEDMRFNYNIKKFISVDTQLKVLPILIALLTGKEIAFKVSKHFLKAAHVQEPEELTKVTTLYEDFLNLKEAFTMLNVDLKTEFISEPAHFYRRIKFFVDLVVNNDISKLTNDSIKDMRFYTLELGGLVFLLFKQLNPANQSNQFISAFTEEVISQEATLEVLDDKKNVIMKCPTSLYINLNLNQLTQIINIDFDIIFKTFKNTTSSMETFELVNLFCLNCIRAYDDTERLPFLDLADKIYSLYDDELHISNHSAILINQLQIKKRKNGSLNSEETKKLIKLKQRATNVELLFCSSVLLGSILEAEAYFDNLTIDQRKEYKNLPIYQLYKRSLPC